MAFYAIFFAFCISKYFFVHLNCTKNNYSMYERNQLKFRTNYNLPEWCLVERNKLIRSAGRQNFGSWSGNYFSCFVQVLFFVQAADSLLTNKCFIMHKKQVKSNIVYDSVNDKNWNMQGFFENLELYYEGKPELMAEDLVTAVKTLLLGSNDIISDAVIEASLHLFYVRDAIQGIEVSN